MPGFLDNLPETLETKLQMSDFRSGVRADYIADYFESIGDTPKAKRVRNIQKISGTTPVIFIIAPPGVAAYVTPDSSPCIYYNLSTLDAPADDEHIITHEKIHLRQKSAWGNMDIPGFSEIPHEARALISRELGMAIDERAIIEGLTESRATQKTRFDKNCAYNNFEVPMIRRLEALIIDITGLSITESFAMMTDQGSRPRFRSALLETANYLVLEDIAEQIIRTPSVITQPKITRQQQENVRLIARDALRKGTIIKIDEAKSHLINASVGILRVTGNTQSRIITALGGELVTDDSMIQERAIISAALSTDTSQVKTIIASRVADVLGEEDGLREAA